MDQELIIAVCDRITSKVPVIRWVDIEDGQLDVKDRPPVVFPCALVDMAYTDCRTLTGGTQRVKAQITVRVAFQRLTPSSVSSAPSGARLCALSRFNDLNALHGALQWWNGGGLFNPLQRLRCIPERRSGDVRVYSLTYETEFTD